MKSSSVSHTAEAAAVGPAAKYIYIACPWTPVGGGMFKVADYLIQAQSQAPQAGYAELRPLDTRGAASAVNSIWILCTALVKLVRGRVSGRLAGVHVNMAEKLSQVRKSVIVVACRLLGVPVVLHLHAATLHHRYRTMPRPAQTLTRWIFSLPARCMVLGDASRRFVTEDLGVAPDAVEIVINGVPEPVVPRRRAEHAGVQRVLFLGNLSRRKGIPDLLDALALPGFDRSRLEVSIAGRDDVEGYSVRAKQLGIDDFVKFVGWADQAVAARLLAQADALILPSHDEGLPLVILEALSNGVAVICTPVGEIPGVLADGITACFVRPGDAQDIARGLQRLLGDPQLRATLERNGRLLFEREFSLARFFDSIARIHRRHFGVCGQRREAPDALRQLVQ